MNTKTLIKSSNRKEGITLFTVMALLATLSLLASFSYVVMKTDLAISANYLSGTRAYYQSESGVYYVRNQLERGLKAGSLTLHPGDNAVNYEPPGDYDFDPVTIITQMADTNAYTYTVTGHDRGSDSSIEVVVFRRPLMTCGLLGDDKIDFQPGVEVYSYDSNRVPNPTPPDSTGEATIGSNLMIEISPGVTLDGVVNIGIDQLTGAPATYSGPADWILEPSEFLDPDPLGAIGGDLEADFIAAIAVNNNANAVPPIVGNIIDMAPHDVLTLPAGDYYVTEIDTGPGGEIIIDATLGPVNIYLDGEAYFGPSCDFSGALPTEFSLFSRSTEDILIQPNGSFAGLVYAPFAEATVKPGMDGYGVIWSELTHLFPTGDWYIDINLVKSYLSDELEFACWKEIRN